MFVDNDPTYHLHIHLADFLHIYRASWRTISCCIQHSKKHLRSALDDSCSIFIHLQHFGQQYNRSGQRGQGNVTDQAYHETLIFRCHERRSIVLPVSRTHYQPIYGHCRPDYCHSAFHDSNVQLVYLYNRSHDTVPCRIGHRQHQRSLPSRIDSSGHLHHLLHGNSRNHENGRSYLLERRTHLRNSSYAHMLPIFTRRQMEKQEHIKSALLENLGMHLLYEIVYIIP